MQLAQQAGFPSAPGKAPELMGAWDISRTMARMLPYHRSLIIRQHQHREEDCLVPVKVVELPQNTLDQSPERLHMNPWTKERTS